MAVKYIQTGDFLPDSPSHGEGTMDLIENALPDFAGYRSLSKDVVQAENDTTRVQGINGAHAHVYLVESNNQEERPLGVIETNHYEGVGNGEVTGNFPAHYFRRYDENTQTDLQDLVGGETADDSEYIVAGGGQDGVIRFLFPEFETPSAGTGWFIRVRYRIDDGVSGAWTVSVELFEGATSRYAKTAIASQSTTTTNGWVTKDWALPDLSAFTTHDDIRAEITIETNGAGDVNFYPLSTLSNSGGWTDENDGSTDIYQSIDETVTDDADYIQSPNVESTGASPSVVFEFDANDPLAFYPTVLGGAAGNYTPAPFVVYSRVRTNHDNVQPYLQVKESDDSVVLSSTELTVTNSASFSDVTKTLNPFLLTLFKDLKVEYQAKITNAWKNAEGTIGTAEPDLYTDYYPTAGADGGGGTWTGTFADVDDTGGDGDFLDFVRGISTQSFAEYTFDLGNYVYPGIQFGSVVTIRMKTSSAPMVVDTILKDANGTEITKETNSVSTGTFADFDMELNTTTIMDKVGSGPYPLKITIRMDGPFVSTDNLQISSVYITSPEPARAYVSRSYFEFVDNARGSVSWVELSMPSTNANYSDDAITIYGGDNEKLWLVDPVSGFTDYTRGSGDYAQSTDPARPWTFCSWGNDVVATNYVDDVQWYPDPPSVTGEFEKLITSTAEPKAKFCAVGRDQLFLAHCQGTGASESFSDTVWWSAVGDPQDFDPDITTLCDNQRLVDTPGQITGLVGGNYVLVFKRNSVYRFDWVGYPVIWDYQVLSYGIGTPYPKSIVKVGNDVFFYSDGGFAVVRDGRSVEYVNSSVRRFLGDPLFSNQGLIYKSQTTGIFEDLAVIGAYDSKSRNVFWFYSGPNALLHDDYNGIYQAFNDAIVLNTSTGKWGYVNTRSDEDTQSSTDKFTKANVTAAINVYTPNLVSSAWNSGSGFFGYQYDNVTADQRQVYEQFVDSDPFTSKFITQRFQIEPGVDVKIHGIRPVFSVDRDREAPPGVISNPFPDITITVESHQDPAFNVSKPNPDNVTLTMTDIDNEGWFKGRIAGEWFRFTFEFAEGPRAIKEFLGFFVDYEPRSAR